MKLKRKHILLTVILLILLFSLSVLGFSSNFIINNSIKRKIKSSNFGIKIDLNITNYKNEPLPFSKIKIEGKNGKHILLFTDENGCLSIAFNNEFYNNFHPEIKAQSNFNDKKVRIKFKINELEKSEDFETDTQLSFFISQIIDIKEHKDETLKISPISINYEDLKKWDHLCGQIDFFFKLNNKKNYGTTLIIIEGASGEEEILQIFSDNKGYFRFYLDKEYIASNPKVILFGEQLDNEKPIEYITRERAILKSTGERVLIKALDKKKLFNRLLLLMYPEFRPQKLDYFYLQSPYKYLKKIETQNFIAYYHENEKNEACRIVKNIENDIKQINQTFKMDINFVNKNNIFIHDVEPNKYYVIPKEIDFPSNFVRADVKSSRYFLIHEIIESYIVSVKIKSLYKNDKFTRWIGDGLAEFMSFYFCKQENNTYYVEKKFFNKVIISKANFYNKTIDDYKIKNYNIKNFEAYSFMEDLEGFDQEELYVMSTYFWYKIVTKCGNEIIGEFLEKASRLEKPTNKELIPLLSEITGLNIEEELNINIEEVIEFVNNN